jgi:myosin-9
MANLDPDHYQVGKTKIFLRESEKEKLDYRLHLEIIKRIVTIQRWVRTRIQRNSFLRFRDAAIRIQAQVKNQEVKRVEAPCAKNF